MLNIYIEQYMFQKITALICFQCSIRLEMVGTCVNKQCTNRKQLYYFSKHRDMFLVHLTYKENSVGVNKILKHHHMVFFVFFNLLEDFYECD